MAGERVRETIREKTAELNETSNSMISAFRDLTEAYQQIAKKNSVRLTESMKELGTVKDPAGFVELQERFAKDAIENAKKELESMRAKSDEVILESVAALEVIVLHPETSGAYSRSQPYRRP